MRKKNLLMVVACTVLATANASTAAAQENCLADKPQPSAPGEPDGVIGDHEYVDLGLPSGSLWATYNVGATSPYETGDFFAWGEVDPKENFTWENYKFFVGYEYDPNNGSWAILRDIGSNICGTEYDAARYQWGNGWRLPNEAERYELRMLCWQKYTTENGVSGARIYGPNGHSIFLPGCGFGLWYGQEDPFNSTDAAYWTGEEEPDNGYNGRPIEPSTWSKNIFVQYGGMQSGQTIKAYGICIRAVVNTRELGVDNVISDSGKVSLTYRDGCIYISGSHADGTVNIYDVSGRLVYSNPVTQGVCHTTGIAGGVYLVSYADNGKTVTTQKITIK